VRQSFVDGSDEASDMSMEISPEVDRSGIEEREILETIRKHSRAGHAGAVDQDRDDVELLAQCCLDFDANRIVVFLQSRPAVGTQTEPIRPDDSKKNIGLGQGRSDVLAEIDPEWNVVDVHKHRLGAEMRNQPIGDPAGSGP
jgi:hypothetical protein